MTWLPSTKDIHFRPKKTIKRFFGTADDRLILVEGRIENHRMDVRWGEWMEQMV
jgi:hypothetical protein